MNLVALPLPFEPDFPEACANCLAEGPLRYVQVGLERKEGLLPRHEFSYGPHLVVGLPVCASCADTVHSEPPSFWDTVWLWLGGLVIGGIVLGRFFKMSTGLCLMICAGLATVIAVAPWLRRSKSGQSSAHRPVWLEGWKGWWTHTEVTLGFSHPGYAERFRELNKLVE